MMNRSEPITPKTIKSSDGAIYGTHPVGSIPAGVSPYGCMDMAGNVWQWCADWYGEDYYLTAHAKNPTGPVTGTKRVIRGGCWMGKKPVGFLTTYRCYSEPDLSIGDITMKDDDIGFRCVVKLPTP